MAKDLRLKVRSFLPSRRFHLLRIRRGVALEVALDAARGDRIGETARTFHHVVAVKIVAAEAAEPAGPTDERRMRNVERVVFHLELAMTVLTVSGLHRDAAAGVLAVTACASLGGDRLASVGKARLVETKDGMAIERPFMTCGAIAVFHFSEAEVDGCLAQSEEKASASLDLLPHGTRSRSMAARTVELPVPYVHFSRSREVLLARREQRAQRRVGQAEPDPYPHPSPLARRRRGSARSIGTTLHRLRWNGDCRKTVILSIITALRLHGIRVNLERLIRKISTATIRGRRRRATIHQRLLYADRSCPVQCRRREVHSRLPEGFVVTRLRSGRASALAGAPSSAW